MVGLFGCDRVNFGEAHFNMLCVCACKLMLIVSDVDFSIVV